MLTGIKNRLFLYYQTKILHKTMTEINLERYKAAGIKIGERCIFCCDLPIGRDSTLLSFGDDCLVSVNVRFLMHDAAPTVVSDSFTDILGG